VIGLVESTKRRIGSVQDRDLEPEKLRRKRIKNIHETLPIGGTKIPSIGNGQGPPQVTPIVTLIQHPENSATRTHAAGNLVKLKD